MPVYRTDDGTKWGTGKGSNLTPAEVDDNIWELRTAIDAVIASPPVAVSIVSVSQSDDKTQLTFNTSDSESIGPFTLPVLEFRWRDIWEPATLYEVLDIFQVPGVGMYAVVANHTSAGVFDKNAVSGSPPVVLYKEMFVFAPAQNIVYDMGFYYPGMLKDIPGSVDRIYEEPIARKILLPVVPMSGSFHRAHLRTPASTAVQDFVIYQNSTNIGTVHFEIASNAGTVTINADVNLIADVDMLGVGRQGADDAVAAGLSIVFAAQQVIGV
jgi:hypothetical protein